ncbi:MAG: hypothetical protein WAZ27_04515 [Minisyncoccia bacterium]
MEPIEILGILSALLTLSAFVANEWGKLSAESFWYDLMNFVASIGLLIYAVDAWAIPFIITNAVWGLISGIDVVKYLLKSKGLKRRSK